MTSPIFYTQLSLALMSLTICVIFFLAWRSLGERSCALSWSIAFLAATVYWVLVMLRDRFPSLESSLLTANVFAVIVVTLSLHGHCQRTGCKFLPANLWPYAALVYAALVWTTVIQPHGGLAASIVPFTSAISLLLSALVILTHRDRPRPAEWAAAITMVAFAVAQIAAVVHLSQHGRDLELVAAQLFVHPSFVAMPSGLMGISMFVIFMLASDVSEEMKEMAVRDQLTGLLNRRGFGEQATNSYATARRAGRSISVIMADLDHFKDVNDKYGHAAGDAALEHFARLLTHERRTEDIVARMGGEEFALVLPGTALEKCIAIAEELCTRLAATPFIVDGRSVDMTSSFGVATISNRDTCLTDVIVRADRALYRSKRGGRNRVDLESSQLMRKPDGTLRSVS